jgi:hypothetical protein
LRNSNTQGIADIRFFFGNPGDVPIVGDFNGNDCDTVSIYRPSEGRVFIINELGVNDGGLGAADFAYFFGNPGDKPFVGDFNNDGTDTIGLHRESTGFVYFRNSHTQGVADNSFFFGNPGDRFVAGDWTADGTDTPGIFRPGNTTWYFRYTNTQGNADDSLTWGASGWLPVAGKFGESVSRYYTQVRDASGVTVEASSAVDPRALDIAIQVVDQMLRGRDDIRVRLVQQEAALAIIPKDSFVTELPEFAWLSGQTDRNGNAYDSFAIRGLGAVQGQPVTATSEENLLGLPGDPFRAESVAHHEFAHAVMNLGFTTDDLSRWRQFYEDAVQNGTFPGTFAMVHQDEYFAELSQSYFSVNNEIGGPSAVQSGDPAAFSFLKEVYGDV